MGRLRASAGGGGGGREKVKRPLAHTRALTLRLGRGHRGGEGGGAESSRTSADGESRPPALYPWRRGLRGCGAGVGGGAGWGVPGPIHSPPRPGGCGRQVREGGGASSEAGRFCRTNKGPLCSYPRGRGSLTPGDPETQGKSAEGRPRRSGSGSDCLLNFVVLGS